MSVPTVSIHRANDGHNSSDDQWFDAFHFIPGQDESIRWLSRPNQGVLQEACSRDAEKFRITFDVENFQPQQIKIYIMNGQLTISGVYEERSEGRYMQKQFEKSFDIPDTAEVEAMAAYITPAHMLVVEIPLNPNQHKQAPKVDHLNVNAGGNNQRRLSFSLDKFNTLNNQSPFFQTNSNQDTLPAPPANQQIRRTSITKTTTTTTTSGSGSNGLPADLTALLGGGGGGDAPQPNSSTPGNERRGSVAVPHQIIINEPPSSPAANNQTTSRTVLTDSDLANLAIDIPPELLALGGTITIQKRRVSVTRTADPNHPNSPPAAASSISTPSNSQGAKPAASSPTPAAAAVARSSNQPSSQPKTGGIGGSTATLTSNEKKTFTLEEFLGNKTWNPSIMDNYDGKKILYMRLEIGQGITVDQFRITLSGHDLRVEMLGNAPDASSNEKSYRQVTLFPTCDVEQLKTTLKKDGFLHIQVPIQL